jgi:acyl-CoA synthetase (AMP-forming)/AMP-acid ligase II
MSVFEKLLPEQQQQQNIKVAITGGAPSSPALMTKFKKMFPDAKLLVIISVLLVYSYVIVFEFV